ncbi:hypothetical protein J4212_03805 [Candidatus Woesearchaeota archaeon]|nr:hypothetical protein [Candidatus Woesearchaeota archaeon]
MKDAIKKSFLLGLGAASLTKKKAEQVAGQIAKRANLDSKGAKDIARTFISAADRERKRMQKLAESEAGRMAKEAEKVSRQVALRLNVKLQKLQKKLEKEGRKTAKGFAKKL